MTKIVKSIQLPINNTTPVSEPNYAVLYASASSVYLTNDSGQTFDLTKSTAYTNIIYFTGSANGINVSYEWNKPPGLRYLEVCAVGSGGGGGAGSAANSPRNQGGAGGGGGAIIWASFASFQLNDATYSINIGRGGAGGVGVSTIFGLGIGANGSDGGDVTVTGSSGNIIVKADSGKGGSGGAGSGAKYGRPGFASASIPIASGINGCPGGFVSNIANSSNDTAGRGFDIFEIYQTPESSAATGDWGFGAARGGAGGWYSSSLFLVAQSGSSGFQYNTRLVNNSAGTSFPGIGGNPAGTNGGNGQDNLVTTLLRFSGSIESTYGLGGGGHGGGAGINNGGHGGNAGYYGAGGGGGGAVLLNQTQGNGGSGSAGLVIFTEYYF